ncbi:MAG: hypothetical protein J5494_01655, partial [Candidatus Methanomethylophilaceae archaeon]|nr:hypothetical protein [Candidatus Methanomethylophilaceae archaeon]
NVTVQAVSNGAGKELCAYIVGDADAESVKEWVSGRKPAYMVPAFIVKLDSIPLNINGKVDRKALPVPDLSSLRSEYAAPRNETERKLCEALEEVLGVDRVGIDDDFIRLGGDSLKAVRLSSVCLSRKIEISAGDIIAKRTVRSLSSSVTQAEDAGSYSGPIDLSPIQKRFMSSGTPAQRNRYNQSVLLRASGKLDIGLLQKAMDSVTDHHDMLRAVYNESPFIRGPGTSVCTVTRCSAGPDKMTEIMDSLQGSLSLPDGRLIACCIIDSDSEYLFIAVHHMIIDGISWSIVLDDLASSYSSIAEGKLPELPPRTVSFNQWLIDSSSDLSAEEYEYWKESAEHIRAPAEISGCVPFVMDAEINLSDLRNNGYGFETSDILFASLALAYKDLTGSDEITVRMEGHGRSGFRTDRTVGWFTDLYPLTLKTGNTIIRTLFESRKALKSVPRGGIGYSRLSESPALPQITFNYLSDAFVYSGSLFKSVYGIPMGRTSDMPPDEVLSLNINDGGEAVILSGFHDGTEIMSSMPSLFIEKLRLIRDYLENPGVMMRPLSDSQLNVYLDEISHSKGTAYNAPGILRLGSGYSRERILDAI